MVEDCHFQSKLLLLDGVSWLKLVVNLRKHRCFVVCIIRVIVLGHSDGTRRTHLVKAGQGITPEMSGTRVKCMGATAQGCVPDTCCLFLITIGEPGRPGITIFGMFSSLQSKKFYVFARK